MSVTDTQPKEAGESESVGQLILCDSLQAPWTEARRKLLCPWDF